MLKNPSFARAASALGLLVLPVLPATAGIGTAEDFLGNCGKTHLMPQGLNAAPGRKYVRDRLIDIRHLALKVTPDFKTRAVAGEATITFAPVGKPLKELELDSVDLEILAVTGKDCEPSGHRTTEDKLIISFAKEIPRDAPVSVTITYRTQPANGLYFRTPEMGYPAGDTQCWTQGEAEFHRYWFPCYDYPNERFSSSVICRAPEGMEVVSNGRLLSKQKGPDGLVEWSWLQEGPHVNYLIALAVGNFHRLEGSVGKLPLALLVPPSEKAQAEGAFRDTASIISFFQEEIGTPFPWDKYYQVYCHDFLAGGMENTSCSFMAAAALFPPEVGRLDSLHQLDAHETAHQWFGDLVTCRDWSHLWLNEGFASYYTILFEEKKNGRDEMLLSLKKAANRVIESKDTRPIVYKDYAEPMEQFDSRAYPKGAWVLHMLRARLGPDLFREGIRRYLELHRNGIVTTDDLQDALEEVSGLSLDRFFDQWVHKGGVPEVDVSWSWDGESKLAKVTVRQTQKTDEKVPVFNFPLPVRFHLTREGAAEAREVTLDVTKAEEEFYFPLPAQPDLVRPDPDMTVLAKWKISPPADMLKRQLGSDFTGRLLAAELLGDKNDEASVALLAGALNGDASHAVRAEAAKSLQKAGTSSARAALIAGLGQPDERVRRAVVDALLAVYHPEARAALVKHAAVEKNPAVLAAAVSGFASWPQEDVLPLLNTRSYHGMVAASVIDALRGQNRKDAAPAVLAWLKAPPEAMEPRDFGRALESLAFLSRERKEDDVYSFLAAFLNDSREARRTAAARALGSLGDPRALPVLRGLARVKRDPASVPASAAIARIESLMTTPEQTQEAWSKVESLTQRTEDLEKKLEALQKKNDALPKAPEPQPK